mgnify:FL=1
MEIAIWIVFLKAITIGSEFGFVYWLKYGSRYVKWYFNRPPYKEKTTIKTVPPIRSLADAMNEIGRQDAEIKRLRELPIHTKDILTGRGFTDPLVQEIQAALLEEQ